MNPWLARLSEPALRSGAVIGNRKRLFWLLAIPALMGLASCARAATPELPTNNGLTVGQEFVTFYLEHGQERIIGIPLTGPYTDLSGRRLQYFTRQLLELDETRPADQQVAIHPLGRWAYGALPAAAQEPVVLPSSQAGLSRNGYTILGEFLAFYEAYGGVAVFGEPLSDPFILGDRRVQFFENARLEWHPELPLAERVQVGLLGQAHYWAVGLTEHRAAVSAIPVPQAAVREARLRASLARPILYSGQEQSVSVQVSAFDNQPVTGIEIQAVVEAGRDAMTIPLGVTDENGRLRTTLPLAGLEPGRWVEVVIMVVASDDEIIAMAPLRFQTWW